MSLKVVIKLEYKSSKCMAFYRTAADFLPMCVVCSDTRVLIILEWYRIKHTQLQICMNKAFWFRCRHDKNTQDSTAIICRPRGMKASLNSTWSPCSYQVNTFSPFLGRHKRVLHYKSWTPSLPPSPMHQSPLRYFSLFYFNNPSPVSRPQNWIDLRLRSLQFASFGWGFRFSWETASQTTQAVMWLFLLVTRFAFALLKVNNGVCDQPAGRNPSQSQFTPILSFFKPIRHTIFVSYNVYLEGECECL